MQNLTREQTDAQEKFQDQLKKLIFLNQKLPGHSLAKYCEILDEFDWDLSKLCSSYSVLRNLNINEHNTAMNNCVNLLQAQGVHKLPSKNTSFQTDVLVPGDVNLSRNFKSESRLSQPDTAMNMRKVSTSRQDNLNLVGDRLLCSKDSRMSASNARLNSNYTSTNNLSSSAYQAQLCVSNADYQEPHRKISVARTPKMAARTVSHNHLSGMVASQSQPRSSPRPSDRRASLHNTESPQVETKNNTKKKPPLKEKKSVFSGLFGKKK